MSLTPRLFQALTGQTPANGQMNNDDNGASGILVTLDIVPDTEIDQARRTYPRLRLFSNDEIRQAILIPTRLLGRMHGFDGHMEDGSLVAENAIRVQQFRLIYPDMAWMSDGGVSATLVLASEHQRLARQQSMRQAHAQALLQAHVQNNGPPTMLHPPPMALPPPPPPPPPPPAPILTPAIPVPRNEDPSVLPIDGPGPAVPTAGQSFILSPSQIALARQTRRQRILQSRGVVMEPSDAELTQVRAQMEFTLQLEDRQLRSTITFLRMMRQRRRDAQAQQQEDQAMQNMSATRELSVPESVIRERIADLRGAQDSGGAHRSNAQRAMELERLLLLERARREREETVDPAVGGGGTGDQGVELEPAAEPEGDEDVEHGSRGSAGYRDIFDELHGDFV